jgi:RNA polymerase sigma-70 factor (ECF subfamily)
MAAALLDDLIGYLRLVVAPSESGAVSDGQLLERFLARRDEAAFEELVRRHGPMVLGACRRVLGNSHDADDAFQATFLVLVRRAASVRPRSQVGNFLYGVAYRTALEARRAAARRRLKEASVMPRPEPPPDTWSELAPLLDQELSRLPARYRAPLLLCDVEGKTRKEAALLLGWPEGTVSSRLSRAREVLARRLSRHGVGLSGVALAVALSQQAQAAVPAVLVGSTVRAALLGSAGQAVGAGLVGPGAAALTERVVRAMWMMKVKVATGVLLAAGLVGLAAYQALAAGAAGETTAPSPARAVSARVEEKAARVEEKAERQGEKKGVSVKDLPPVVVQTVPKAGDTKVDAGKVKEVRVTFSKDMMDKSWTWSQYSEETFPKVTGKVHYAKDRRTCVLPVKLEPGKTYAFWLNSEKFQNFKDADGNSAVPYLLVFETKP